MKTKRKKELNKEDFQEKKAKDLIRAAQKEQRKVKRKLEQRLHRQQKKERQVISTCVVTSPAFKSKPSEEKAVQQVFKRPPKSPRRQKAVVKKLAIKLFHGKTIFEKKKKIRNCLYFQKL